MNGQTHTLYEHLAAECDPENVLHASAGIGLRRYVSEYVDVVADGIAAGGVLMWAMEDFLDEIEWDALAARLRKGEN